MVKVYVAAKYGRRFELRSAASPLRSNGVVVTSRWLGNEGPEAGGSRASSTDGRSSMTDLIALREQVRGLSGADMP
jgi:hypothetical protein